MFIRNRLIDCIIGAIFFGMLMFWLASVGYCSNYLILNQSVVVDGDEILLKDIAYIPHEMYDKLSAVVIGTSPLPGRSRIIKKSYVKLRLKQVKIEDINIHGDEVIVVRSSQKLDINKVIETGKTYLLQHIQSQGKLEVIPTVVPDEVILPKGKVELYVDKNYKLPKWNKRFFLPIIVKVNGRQVRTLRVGFKLQEMQSVVVATKELPVHHVITSEDIEIKEMDVTYLRNTPITTVEEAIGKRTKYSVSRGNILVPSMLEMPPVVERGDKVTITSIKGKLMITAAGISCEDGMLGERIRVRNIDTERIVSGVVCRDKMVLVD